MMLNKATTRKIIGIVTFAVILYWSLQNYKLLFGLLGTVLGLISPFILGACIAFILNVPMRAIEARLFPASPKRLAKLQNALRRPLSMSLTIILVVGLILAVTVLVIPEIVRSLTTLKDSLPVFWANTQAWAEKQIAIFPDLAQSIASINLDWQKIGDSIIAFVKDGAGSLFSSTFSLAASIFSGIVTFFLGCVFAIYILAQKENLGRQFRQILKAYVPEQRARKVLDVSLLADKTFSRFLSGQCTEAVILGLIFLAAMLIFQFPYAVLISVLIAFTALIPLIGSFIGCAVGMFLILMVNPIQAIWFLVMFLIIQQIEGNLIYPRVVGNSVGLPSIWMLVAVTVGGSLFGVAGMLIFIPLCSVLYALFRETVYQRLAGNDDTANSAN